MKIVKYTKKYEEHAKDFKCGNIVLDNYIKNGNAFDERQGVTYILLSNDETRYISDYLLRHCEKRILEISKQVGVTFITLFSTERGYYLYHNRNEYEDFEDDMSIVAKESDVSCRKLYKWIEDIKV